MWLTSWEWEHFIGIFADIWCILRQPPTGTTGYCGHRFGHRGNWNLSLDSCGKSIRSIGNVCGQEVVASQREKRAVSGAELPQNKYWLVHPWSKCSCLTLGQENHMLLVVPLFLIVVDRELLSRSKVYLLTHLLLTSLVPIALMQTWVSQPNHAQPRQVALMMKTKWELPPLTWVVRKPSRYEVDSSLSKVIKASHIVVSACDTVTFPGDCMLLFNAMPMSLGHGRDNKIKKVHICA